MEFRNLMQRSEVANLVLGGLLATACASIVALFFKGDSSQVLDILKLAIQGIGALLIAHLTVHWAIQTFKSQKSWERDATTYAELVAALREMKRIHNIWLNHEFRTIEYTKEFLEAASLRWDKASAKFGDAAARSIFLPEPIYTAVLKLEICLAEETYDSSLDELDSQSAAVIGTLQEIEAMRHLVR